MNEKNNIIIIKRPRVKLITVKKLKNEKILETKEIQLDKKKTKNNLLYSIEPLKIQLKFNYIILRTYNLKIFKLLIIKRRVICETSRRVKYTTVFKSFFPITKPLTKIKKIIIWINDVVQFLNLVRRINKGMNEWMGKWMNEYEKISINNWISINFTISMFNNIIQVFYGY